MSIAEIVNTWFRQRLAAGAIARNTEAYNQAVEALPALIASLELDRAAAAGSPAVTEAAIGLAGSVPPVISEAPDEGQAPGEHESLSPPSTIAALAGADDHPTE